MIVACVATLLGTTRATSEAAPAEPSTISEDVAKGIAVDATDPLPQPSALERALSEGAEALRRELDELSTEGILHRGTTAVYVVDANTGEPLYATHQDDRLNPASNVKLISTATALDILGPAWRYTTRLFGVTPDAEGTVASDLYLAGNYDPTLDGDVLEDLAARVAEAGVRRVAGDVVVGRDPLRDSIGWPRLAVRVRGTRPGDAPEVEIDLPLDGSELDEEVRAALLDDFIEVEVTAETIRRRRRPRIRVSVSLLEDPGPRYRVTVAGTISKRRRTRVRRRVPSPQVFTAHLLRLALAQAGVGVDGSVRRSGRLDYVLDMFRDHDPPVELARHESRSLSDLVARINKRSLNRLADRVIMTAAAMRYGGPLNMKKGVRAMHAWLNERAGVDPNALLIDTGSGLSYNTELTARQIVRVVRAAAGFDRAAPVGPGPARGDGPELERLAEASPEAALDAMGARLSVQPAVSERESQDDPDAEARRRFGREAGDGLQPMPGPGRGIDGDGDDGLGEAAADVLSDVEQVFLDSLAVGGVDGTLRGRFRSLRGAVHAKTGTLTSVIALSGVVSHGGETLAFSIVTNGNRHRKRRYVRRRHEAIVKALHRYLRERAQASD